KLCRHFVGQLLRCLACTLSGALDLLPMLVRPGQKVSIEAHHALAAGNRVAGNGRVGVSDVGARIHVVDGSRDVKLFAHDLQTQADKNWQISDMDFRWHDSLPTYNLRSAT